MSGISVQDLKNKYVLNDLELEPYLPADPRKLSKLKAQVHYLGYYIKWHPQNAYYYSVEHGGFQASPERTQGTYSKYNSIDDKIDDLHYYTTFIKFGIGRTTYDAAQEVRSGDITREEAIALIHRFDGEYPDRFETENFKYLSIDKKDFPKAYRMLKHPEMTRRYFMKLANKFRSPHLWKKVGGNWELRYQVTK